MNFNGRVKFINQNPYNGKTLHSFKLDTADGYFGTGYESPNVSVGDAISFEAKPAAKAGNFSVDLNSLFVDKSAPPQEQRPVYAKKSGSVAFAAKSNSKDSYWETKEARDIITQRVIQLQASRNSAIATAELLMKHGAVAGFEKAKQAEKMDVLLGLVDHLVERFQKASKDIRLEGTIAEVGKMVEIPKAEALATEEDWG